jgi:DNA end-binding protein Ku
LLRNALVETGKIAIARVVIRARQHLAAIKPKDKVLILELMHFPEELLDASEIKPPAGKPISKPEMQMAKQLIENMTSKWESERYSDAYHEALEKLIREKVKHDGKEAPALAEKRRPTNVVDLTSALRQSLQKGEEKHAVAKKKLKSPKRAA